MRWTLLSWTVAATLTFGAANAADREPSMIVLDASNSMRIERGRDGSANVEIGSRIAARALALQDASFGDARSGLTVFGSFASNNNTRRDCSNVDIISPPGSKRGRPLSSDLSAIRAIDPQGRTPILETFRAVGATFGGQRGSIALISDFQIDSLCAKPVCTDLLAPLSDPVTGEQLIRVELIAAVGSSARANDDLNFLRTCLATEVVQAPTLADAEAVARDIALRLGAPADEARPLEPPRPPEDPSADVAPPPSGMVLIQTVTPDLTHFGRAPESDLVLRGPGGVLASGPSAVSATAERAMAAEAQWLGATLEANETHGLGADAGETSAATLHFTPPRIRIDPGDAEPRDYIWKLSRVDDQTAAPVVLVGPRLDVATAPGDYQIEIWRDGTRIATLDATATANAISAPPFDPI